MAREKWYRGGLRFECTRCGRCCSGAPGYVWVTKTDIARIARFLGREDDGLDKGTTRRVGLRHSLTESPDGDCVFLVRENHTVRCSIHPVRPLQCRTWPFWTSNLRSPDAWNEAHRTTCPGINSGKYHDLAHIERLRKARTCEDAGV
ncbi:MAG: YkgJ family cysteine cluster protein [Phycisphaerales bacterium]|nr:MAG: YkgJ family cysteine cluster protein [Phycisphaerales bacterium]